MKEFKKQMILDTAHIVCQYVFDTTGEDIDPFDVAELIDGQLGFYIDDSNSIGYGSIDDMERMMLDE